jgi:hypothetical protein
MKLNRALEVIHGEVLGAQGPEWLAAAILLTEQGIAPHLSEGVRNLVWALIESDRRENESHHDALQS